MDYATLRGLFFAPPAAPRPPSPATGHHTPARRLRDAIEPLACQAIWSPEAAEDYAALGLDDYLAAYVWQRTAALGVPPTALAVTALGVFAPDLVGPVYEKGVAALSRADVVRIRLDAPGRTLRRELGNADAEAGRAVALLRRGIDAAETTARPLFTGLRADPWPQDPLAALVHACNLLREHRGDSHLAACAAAGLDPVQSNVLTELWCGFDLLTYTPSRGWSGERMDAAVASLRARGLVEGDGLSGEGLRFRGELEATTDAMQQTVVDAIGPDLDALTKQLGEWSDALVAAGAAPPDPAKRQAG